MSQNALIIKNSLLLYIQLLITTTIGLYTTRIVLLQLGADDFGLYSVIGGIVSMMGFLSTAMLSTSYRYIAVELGKGSDGDPNRIFNTTLVIHLCLALLLLIFGETFGIWYIKNYLNIDTSKIDDAIYVLHWSVIASVVSIAVVPYQGLLTARENFRLRSIIDIIKAILKLIFTFLLIIYLGNKLRIYALMMSVALTLPSVFLIIHSFRKYRKIVAWKFNRQKSDYKDMFNFTGWITFGTISYMGVRQGAALILNIFFGTVINAAFGIASQVNNYIMLFVKNLNQAAVPQIMKNYSRGDQQRSLNLVYSISKFSFFIMLIPSVPIILSINAILKLWLKEVPEYSRHFILLMIINGLIGITSSGFDAAIQATGKIKKVHIWYSAILLSTLPTAFFCYKINMPPYSNTLLFILASIVYRFVQIKILKELTEFKPNEYWQRTMVPTFLVSLLVLPQFYLRKLFGNSLPDVIIFSLLSVTLIIISIFIVGLTKNERLIISNTINKIRFKFKTDKKF